MFRDSCQRMLTDTLRDRDWAKAATRFRVIIALSWSDVQAKNLCKACNYFCPLTSGLGSSEGLIKTVNWRNLLPAGDFGVFNIRPVRGTDFKATIGSACSRYVSPWLSYWKPEASYQSQQRPATNQAEEPQSYLCRKQHQHH